MTRRDYIEVAAILRRASVPRGTREELVRAFAALFRRDNPRFDKTKFYEAAGVDPAKAPGPFA